MYTKESLKSEKYTWGKLAEVYEIANYLIVAYYPTKYENGSCLDGQYEEKLSFHPYINGRDTNHSFGSLDNALIHCVSCNNGHSRASEFIINMLSYKD